MGFRTSSFPKKQCALARQNPLKSRQKILGTRFARSAWVRVQNPLVRLLCVYFTKSEPVFKMAMSARTTSAMHTLHAGGDVK